MKLTVVVELTAIASALTGCDMPHVSEFREKLQERFDETNGGINDEAARVYVQSMRHFELKLMQQGQLVPAKNLPLIREYSRKIRLECEIAWELAETANTLVPLPEVARLAKSFDLRQQRPKWKEVRKDCEQYLASSWYLTGFKPG